MSRSIGGQVFDYYVDPASGSDANPGTLALPLATLSQADTLIGASTGKRVGLKAETTLRNDPVSFGAAGTYVGVYGSGAMPESLGSSPTAVSSFTKVGNLYSIAHTVNPFTLALVDGSGNATKLYMASTSNGNSAVNPATEGEWTFFPATHATPNLLKFYTTATITGYQVEIPQGGSALTGIAFTAANCTLDGIAVKYWSGSGTTVGGNNMVWNNVTSSYNGGDGLDADQASKDFLALRCTGNYNGQRYNGSNGPGDGFSAHSASPAFATGSIIGCTFIGNTQTGIGNQVGAQVSAFGCYLANNYYNTNVYNVADALVGSHTFDYCVMVQTVQTGGDKWYNSSGSDGTANEATPVKFRNCTIYFNGVTTTPAATLQGFTPEIINCAAKLPATVSNFAQIVAGTVVTSTNNISNGQSAAMWRSGPFIAPTTETGALTTDPMFANPASGDFTLQAGSPCINAGTNWGQTRDYAGNPVTGTPDRGAYER